MAAKSTLGLLALLTVGAAPPPFLPELILNCDYEWQRTGTVRLRAIEPEGGSATVTYRLGARSRNNGLSIYEWDGTNWNYLQCTSCYKGGRWVHEDGADDAKIEGNYDFFTDYRAGDEVVDIFRKVHFVIDRRTGGFTYESVSQGLSEAAQAARAKLEQDRRAGVSGADMPSLIAVPRGGPTLYPDVADIRTRATGTCTRTADPAKTRKF